MRIDEEGHDVARPLGTFVPLWHTLQDRRLHRRHYGCAHGRRRSVEPVAAERPSRKRGPREGRGARRRNARGMGFRRHEPRRHQSHRGRHLPHEAPRVRGGREVYLHAVYHGDRLLHPLHQRHPSPGRQRAGRVRAGGSGRLQRRPGTQGVLARGRRRRRHAGVSLYRAFVRDRVVPGMPRRPGRRARPVRLRERGHAGRRGGRRHVHHRTHGHLRRRHSRQHDTAGNHGTVHDGSRLRRAVLRHKPAGAEAHR